MHIAVAVSFIIAMFAAQEANALTFCDGCVFENGQMVNGNETQVGQRALDEDGVFVSGNTVFIRVGEHDISVSVHDIVGQPREHVMNVIGAAAVRQIEDLQADAAEHAAELVETGQVDNAINTVGLTVEQVIEQISTTAETGAFVGVSADLHERIQDHFESIDGVRPEACGGPGNPCP